MRHSFSCTRLKTAICYIFLFMKLCFLLIIDKGKNRLMVLRPLSDDEALPVWRAIKQTSLLPTDVKKSINFSYHFLSVTLFWPGICSIAIWKCAFQQLYWIPKLTDFPVYSLSPLKITEGKACVVCESVSEEILALLLTLSIHKYYSYYSLAKL